MKKVSVLLLVVLSFILFPAGVYADGYPIAVDFDSQLAVVGEKFEYTIKGYGGFDKNGSSNLDGIITYDEDIFEFVEVREQPFPEMFDDVSEVVGTVNKKISTDRITFSYAFENYDSSEGLARVDLKFVFKVKSVPANSKSTIKYVPNEPALFFPDGIESEVTVITSEFDKNSVKCTCDYENSLNSCENIEQSTECNCSDSTTNNNVILYCSLGSSAILLIAFIIILTKYLKIKKKTV